MTSLSSWDRNNKSLLTLFPSWYPWRLDRWTGAADPQFQYKLCPQNTTRLQLIIANRIQRKIPQNSKLFSCIINELKLLVSVSVQPANFLRSSLVSSGHRGSVGQQIWGCEMTEKLQQLAIIAINRRKLNVAWCRQFLTTKTKYFKFTKRH